MNGGSTWYCMTIACIQPAEPAAAAGRCRASARRRATAAHHAIASSTLVAPTKNSSRCGARQQAWRQRAGGRKRCHASRVCCRLDPGHRQRGASPQPLRRAVSPLPAAPTGRLALGRDPQPQHEPRQRQRADAEDRVARHAHPDQQLDDRLLHELGRARVPVAVLDRRAAAASCRAAAASAAPSAPGRC